MGKTEPSFPEMHTWDARTIKKHKEVTTMEARQWLLLAGGRTVTWPGNVKALLGWLNIPPPG